MLRWRPWEENRNLVAELNSRNLAFVAFAVGRKSNFANLSMNKAQDEPTGGDLDLVSPLSASSFQITMTCQGNTLGTGTAFLYERSGRSFLVTNWHNVSGINPTSSAIIHKTGAVPDALTVRVPIVERKVDDELIECRHENLTIPLYVDDTQIDKRWKEHPTHGRKVDVVAIPLRTRQLGKIIAFPKGNPYLVPEVGSDVFILGYPLGLSGGGYPIWKRGSIATEPGLDLGGLPKIYVDTATREGMSGAPVFFKSTKYRFFKNRIEGIVGAMPANRFLGVYSGRVGASMKGSEANVQDIGAQLGVIWKESALREIIDGRVRDPRAPRSF